MGGWSGGVGVLELQPKNLVSSRTVPQCNQIWKRASSGEAMQRCILVPASYTRLPHLEVLARSQPPPRVQGYVAFACLRSGWVCSKFCRGVRITEASEGIYTTTGVALIIPMRNSIPRSGVVVVLLRYRSLTSPGRACDNFVGRS